MPQFRKLHTKILTSLDVDALSCDFVRLTWTWLQLVADSEGRGLLHGNALRSQIFPLRSDVTSDMVLDAVHEFAQLGMVELYAVGGREYFQITHWHEYQSTSREAPSSFPVPTQELLTTNSGVTQADPARTSSYLYLNLPSKSSLKKGEYEGETQEHARMTTALASVAKETLAPGFNEDKYESASDLMLERQAKPEEVAAFGAWWSAHGWHNSKPALKNVLDHWDDYKNGRDLRKNGQNTAADKQKRGLDAIDQAFREMEQDGLI